MIGQPSEAAIMAAVTWAKANGTFMACETSEEMFRHAEAWCPRGDAVRAVASEHHVAGPGTRYAFILAPATGELMTPDGFGLIIYVAGVGLLRTLPEHVLTLIREVPPMYLPEMTEALATAQADPSVWARFSLYIHQRTDLMAVATEARAKGIERPVVFAIDVRDALGRLLVGDAKADAAIAATEEPDDTPVVLRAAPMAALMSPESPLPPLGREFLTGAASKDGYCPVIVVADGDTSYFSMPFAIDQERST